MASQKRPFFRSVFAPLTLLGILACSGCQETRRPPAYDRMGQQLASPYSLYRLSDRPPRLGSYSINGERGGEATGGQNVLGYFQYDAALYPPGDSQYFPLLSIDRQLLAEGCAHLLAHLNNVKNNTILVTDDYLFAGITPQEGNLDDELINDAQRLLENLTPRYYKVRILPENELRTKIDAVGIRAYGPQGLTGQRGDLERVLQELGDETPPFLAGATKPSKDLDRWLRQGQSEPQV